MKIVIQGYKHSISREAFEQLRSEFSNIEFLLAKTPEEEISVIEDADVMFGRPSREVFSKARKLKWVQNPGTGIDFIMDNPELANSEVVLTNMRATHAVPMANHAFAIILALAHHMVDFIDDQKDHQWLRAYRSGGEDYSHIIPLENSIMGIVGMGDIGKACASRAIAFGMEVYGVDLNPYPPPPGVIDIWALDKLDGLIKMSDWLLVTLPLTHETKGSIDRRRIELMKKGSYLLVISRGGIIDEDALLDGLKDGRIAGAGLDVTAVEPLPQNSPLWDTDNLIITPHYSAAGPSVAASRIALFKENLRRFIKGEPLQNICNKKEGF